MKLLLDKGIIPFNLLSQSIKSFIKTNELFLIGDKKSSQDWIASNLNFQFVDYEYLKKKSKKLKLQEDHEVLLEKLLADSRTLMILERVSRSKSQLNDDSLFNNSIFLDRNIYNSLILLKSIKPNVLIFQATPHHINSWILGKVAEHLNIKVLLLQNAPLPGRYWCVEGLDSQIPVINNFPTSTDKDYSDLEKYLKKVSGEYDGAIPSYEKKRIEDRRGKYWSWRKELKDSLKDPRILFFLQKKNSLYHLYNSLAKSNPNYDKPYLVFFLHYQPERTSLPEAFHYFQQLFIIKQLSMHIPTGWHLKVKEHPSTFTGKYDPRYRSSEFYKEVNLLENVELISLHINSFELMDKSKGVATITGTVGVEAMMRGLPTLAFGLASYRRFKNCYKVKSAQDIKTFIKKFEFKQKKEIIQETYNDLSLALGKSISGMSDDKMDFFSSNTRIIGNSKVLSFLLDSFKNHPK